MKVSQSSRLSAGLEKSGVEGRTSNKSILHFLYSKNLEEHLSNLSGLQKMRWNCTSKHLLIECYKCFSWVSLFFKELKIFILHKITCFFYMCFNNGSLKNSVFETILKLVWEGSSCGKTSPDTVSLLMVGWRGGCQLSFLGAQEKAKGKLVPNLCT